jgi:hypothetical protein
MFKLSSIVVSLNRWSPYSLGGILAVWMIAAIGFQTWRRGEVIRYDVSSYYSYLPGVFIHGDLSFSYLKNEDRFTIWYEKLPEGRRYQRMTMGVAVFYLPLFLVAHTTALISGVDATGYSMPYALALLFSGLLFAGLGLWLLRKSLLEVFTPVVVHITLVGLALGTNLFYYVSIGGAYSHAFSFFLFALFLRLCLRLRTTLTFKNVWLVGCVLGWIVLIRPTNALIAVIPLLYGVGSVQDRLIGLMRFRKNGWIYATAACAAILVCLPQCLYWKYATGHYLFYTYQGERFFFNQPSIIDFLFSFRKGWLVYTPIMLYALGGLWLLPRRLPALTLPICVYLSLHVYVVSSWWIWWYGGGFGQRPMVETYALLAFPLAAAIEWILTQKGFIRSVLGLIYAFFICLNCFQTVQMRLGILHWDSMTPRAYWRCFLQLKRPEGLDHDLRPPDLSKAYRGLEE